LCYSVFLFVSMCYSAEVSFGTWFFGIMCSILLYQQGKPFYFPFAVSQIQLIEGLRWIDAVDERILSVLGKLALISQPVALFYEGKKYSFVIPYLVIQAINELLYGSRDLRFVVADDGHFSWMWNFDYITSLPYWIGLSIGAYFALKTELVVGLLALFAYFYVNHRQYSTFGSLWCVWSNFMWVYYMLR